MNNRDLEAARRYHQATKHSFLSVRQGAHFLDWQNQPLPFKVYPALEVLRFPRDVPQTGVAALSAVGHSVAPGAGEAVPSFANLAQLLFFSAGITRRRPYPGGTLYFRAAACTGALYEIELYVACGDLPGLEAGLYHFAPAEFGLRRLRSGDWRGALAAATGAEPAVAHAPAIVISTGTYWRNAWKYQARTYRHFGWDNGTILANLLSVSAALGLPAKIVLGFVDDEVNRLLDVDTEREVALSLVALGHQPQTAPPAPASAEAPRLGLETVPYSAQEVDYEIMREVHVASSLGSAEEAAAWRGSLEEGEEERGAPAAGPLRALELGAAEEMPSDTLEQVILRRGSTRRFARRSISFAHLSTMLERATRAVPADFAESGERGAAPLLNQLFLIVNAVEGLEPGAYRFHRRERALELERLKAGEFRARAAYLGLEQELPGDASVDVFFLADLERILGRFGNRGYRAAQLEAGILGGRVYLAAYAQRLGASGLTFYDDEVVSFFSPQAAAKSAIFLTAVGRSAGKQ